MFPDRRLRTNEKPNRAIFLAWLGVSALLLLVAFSYIRDGRLPGPDDALRLVQVRDLIAGQGWFDLHQYRINPPEGVLMHWSRLVDAPLWLLISMLTPLLGQAMAEQVTMIAMPLFLLGLIMIAVGRLAWRIFDVQTAIFACLALGFWPVIVMQMQPMRIDHHAYQVLAVAFAAWALTWRSEFRGGAAAGLAMAAGTMISLEIMPMAAAFGGVLALRWLREYKQRWWLVAYMQALALGQVVIFALTRGIVDIVPHCDAISPPHLAFFIITALATGAFAAAPRIPKPALIALFAGAAGVGAAYFAFAAPDCLAPPFSQLDPVLKAHWYESVTEGLPIWRQDLDRSLPTFFQVAVSMAVVVWLMLRSHDWLRTWWLEYLLLMIVACLSGMMTFRSVAFAAVLGAVPMGWLAGQLLLKFRKAESLVTKALVAIAIYVVLVPSAPMLLVEKFIPKPEAPQIAVRQRESRCEFESNAPLLNALPPALFFAPLDVGPTMILKTHHSTVATGHHRNPDAMLTVINGFSASAADARTIVTDSDADYVLICSDVFEAAKFAKMGGPESLAAMLIDGRSPDWLEPVRLDGPEELGVWRIRRD